MEDIAKNHLETMILSSDILGVAWQSRSVPEVGVTSSEIQTPLSHQLTAQSWASLGLSLPI